MTEKMSSKTGWEEFRDRMEGPIDEQHIAMVRGDFLSDLLRLEQEGNGKMSDPQARETVIRNMSKMGRMPGQDIDPNQVYFNMMVQGYEGSREKLKDEA